MCFGVFYAYAIGNLISYPVLIGMCMLWPFLFASSMKYIPESPYHLYRRQAENSEIKTVLKQIKGVDYDMDLDYNDIKVFLNIIQITSVQ